MIRRYAPATILLISLLLTNGNCEDVSDSNFKTECFTEAEENKESDVVVCEDSRINIKGTFYKCESALTLRSPIERIGFIQEDVLILAGRRKFLVDRNSSDIKAVRRIAPVITQLMDKKGNIYYGGNNAVYAQRHHDNEYVEIITHDVPESHNDIALDETNDNLFILSHFEDDNTSTKKSVLYVVPISSLDSTNDTINAEKLTELNGITSIAFNSVNKFLYIGLQLPTGEGKLIKVKGELKDPCALNESYEEDIEKVVSDFKNKILGVFNKTAINLQSRTINDNDSDKVLALSWENEQLMIRLNSTMIQLEELKRRLYRFGPPSLPGLSGPPGLPGLSRPPSLPDLPNPPSLENNRDSYYNNCGIEERMGSTPSNGNRGYSVNILISPPQAVPLPVNGSPVQSSLLFPSISVNINPGNNAKPFNVNGPPVVEVSTLNPSIIPNQFVRNPVTLPKPDLPSLADTKSAGGSATSSSNLRIVSESSQDSDYSFE